jgi:hypothetical protein
VQAAVTNATTACCSPQKTQKGSKHHANFDPKKL